MQGHIISIVEQHRAANAAADEHDRKLRLRVQQSTQMVLMEDPHGERCFCAPCDVEGRERAGWSRLIETVDSEGKRHTVRRDQLAEFRALGHRLPND